MDGGNGRSILSSLEHSNPFLSLVRQCIFQVLAYGPMPSHIAFILDGNRRFAKKHGVQLSDGYQAGYVALLTILMYCYEMGLRYVTVFAFSIDNFKRRPSEVQMLMSIMLEKINMLFNELTFMNKWGIRVRFVGRLELLDARTRAAAEEVMKATQGNSNICVQVCVAYTSVDEIVRGVQKSCVKSLWLRRQAAGRSTSKWISVLDIQKHMDFFGFPEPDILIRTSGETRLSNFLLWQTKGCLLYAPRCLWPNISLRHLLWAVLLHQRAHFRLNKGDSDKA